MKLAPYSQKKAMLAIASASFKAFFKNPSAIIFSILFPIIFIVLFGSQKEDSLQMKVVLSRQSDTANIVYRSLTSIPFLKILNETSEKDPLEQLQKNEVAAIISIERDISRTLTGTVPYQIVVTSNTLSQASGQVGILEQILNDVSQRADKTIYPERPSVVRRLPTRIVDARAFKSIDFILPGQLGFSLISTGIFGVAFSFFFLRKTQVFKRMFATPIKRQYILLGEGIARFSFQLLTVFIIIGFGYFIFDYTLVNGIRTFVEMLLLCMLGLTVFVGMGFLISNLSSNEQMIPGVANLLAIPQFLLSGSFFSIHFFPEWLQTIAQTLPLTHLNNALRKVAFEGKSLGEVSMEIFILLGFAIVCFLLNVRLFRWD